MSKPKNPTVLNYLKTVSESHFINVHLKYANIFLMIVIVVLAVLIGGISRKINTITPLVFFVDKESGAVRPVDFSVIDATGDRRHESEVEDFITHYLNNLYFFSKYTIESNLKKAFRVTVEEAQKQLKDVLIISRRYEHNQSNMQGICNISNIQIIESSPDILVQASFVKKIINTMGEFVSVTRHNAVIRLKTVPRHRGNAHGFYVIEYRENDIKEEE